jgi:hypothetical protein
MTKPLPKPKIGDKIIILNNDYAQKRNLVGKIGEIFSFSKIYVDFSINIEGHIFHLKRSEFSLIVDSNVKCRKIQNEKS